MPTQKNVHTEKSPRGKITTKQNFYAKIPNTKNLHTIERPQKCHFLRCTFTLVTLKSSSIAKGFFLKHAGSIYLFTGILEI